MNLYYRVPTRRPNGRRSLLIITLLVVAVFLLDVATGGKVRGSVRAVAIAMYHGASATSESVAGTGVLRTKASLEEENRHLKADLAQLSERSAAYEVLKAENEQLRAMTRLAEQRPLGITVRIVSSVTASPYGTFLIGAGSAESVTRGALVETSEGFVVGRVSDVSAHSALVTEIFAPSISIEAVIAGASVIVEGEGGGNARASAPRNLPVHPGDPVVAPTLGGKTVGIVGSVASSTDRASQELLIRTPVNVALLPFVYVITQ